MLSALAARDGGGCMTIEEEDGVGRAVSLTPLRGLPSSNVANTAVAGVDGWVVARRWRRGVAAWVASRARCSSVGAWVTTMSTNSRLIVGGKALRGERMAAVVSSVGNRLLLVDLGDGLWEGAVRV